MFSRFYIISRKRKYTLTVTEVTILLNNCQQNASYILHFVYISGVSVLTMFLIAIIKIFKISIEILTKWQIDK